MIKSLLITLMIFMLLYARSEREPETLLRSAGTTHSQRTPSAPTPYPTPVVNLAPYLHKQSGQTTTISASPNEDLGARVNEAEARLGARPGKIVVQGGGRIRSQIVVSHDLEFRGGTYSCDTPTVWQGCILLKDNIHVACNEATILEPTFQSGGQPAITVFQNYAATQRNEAASRNITVKGCRIVGRQTQFDGGVRQSISFGNCANCAAIDNTLLNVTSIGIQFGGSAGEGNHALNALAVGNTIKGAAAAGIALVNVSGAIVTGNTILAPGRVGGPGGVSGVDIETNAPDDWCENIKVFNNLFDYRDPAFNSVGSAIMAQNTQSTNRSSGLLIANNRVLANNEKAGLTSGIFFTRSFPGGMVVNNYIQRSMQGGFQLYGAERTTFQDNVLVSCGGGGLPAIQIIGGGHNVFRRNRISVDPALGGSASGEIVQTGAVGNSFDVAVTTR
ncbi:MAG: hypothetical protein ACREBG_18335 [Pyrinomonadaceae bacterium]